MVLVVLGAVVGVVRYQLRRLLWMIPRSSMTARAPFRHGAPDLALVAVRLQSEVGRCSEEAHPMKGASLRHALGDGLA